MKKITFLLSVILLAACEKETKKEDLGNTVWVNAKYLETLEKTKSPLKAKTYADTVMVYFNAKADTANMVWNFHEGAPFSIKHDEKIQLFNTYEPKQTPEFEGIIDNGQLKLGSTYFKKVNSIEFIEKMYWVGKYSSNNTSIELMSDGKLNGIDSLATYYVWNDYTITQTDIDLIDLYDKNNRATTYGYKFADNEIIFYEFIWKEDGIVGVAGKEVFRWKKG